ncbi:MAG: hypothetical protein ACI4EA_07740, partial [Candidatus Ornithomonoglobus sp.]
MQYKIFTKSGTGLNYRIKDASGAHSSSGSVSDTAGLTLPAGYSAHITSYSSNSEIGILNSVFTYESADSQVYEAAHIQPGESYVYTNKLDSEMTVSFSSSTKWAYAVFDKDGNLTSTGHSASVGSVKVPAYGCIKMMYFSTSSWGYLPDMKSLEKLDEDLFTVVPMIAGKCRSFTNTSPNEATVVSNNSSGVWMHYELCDADGNVKTRSRLTLTNPISVPAGYTLKVQCIKSVGNNFDALYVLNDIFEIKEDSEKIYDSVHIASGESYIIRSTTGKAVAIDYGKWEDGSGNNNNYMGLSYVIYDADGNISYSSSNNNTWGALTIPEGGYVKIAAGAYRAGTVWAPHGQVAYEKSDIPAVQTVESGDTKLYSFKNNDSESGYVYTSGRDSSWVMYDKTGTQVSSSNLNGTLNEVPSGYTLCVNATSCYSLDNKNMEISCTDSENYLLLEAGKTYKVTNNGNAEYNLSNYGNDAYELYSESGKLISSYYNTTDNITIPIGGYAYIEPYACYGIEINDAVLVEEQTQNIWSTAHIPANGTYLFTNTSDVDRHLLVYNIIYGTIGYSTNAHAAYNYAIYNKDGSVQSSEKNVESTGTLTIPAGCAAAISPINLTDMSMSVKYWTGSFTAEETDQSAYFSKILYPG